MFTGIIKHTASILSINKESVPWQLVIERVLSKIDLGDSIAVNGICLTLSNMTDTSLSFDISTETSHTTAIDHYRPGELVHVERALNASDVLDGHLVTGHIDTTVHVVDKHWHYDTLELVIGGIQNHHWPLITPKGSVTLNGVNLTINQVTQHTFHVMLIPETLRQTNLSNLTIGNEVNIEYDMFAKLINRQIQFYLEGDHDEASSHRGSH